MELQVTKEEYEKWDRLVDIIMAKGVPYDVAAEASCWLLGLINGSMYAN